MTDKARMTPHAGADAGLIIVTGSVEARPDSIAELTQRSLEHVRRSRTEDGCISHAVHVDVENDLRLVFVEQWRDSAALMLHFRQPGSLNFVADLRRLAATAPLLALYQASRIPTPRFGD